MNARSHLLISIAVLTLLAGCGRSHHALAPSPEDTNADETQIGQELARNPDQVDEPVFETDARASIELSDGITAAVDPLFFWRQILRVERAHEFAFADTDSVGRPRTAVVVVHKRLTGWFNLLIATGGDGDPVEAEVIRKRLHDHWIRRIRLARNANDASRPWRIVALSGVKVTSRDAETRIESLRIESGDLDTTVTDPLAFWRLRGVLRLAPEAEVRLTVTTARSDDVVVLYTRDRRRRFHAEGDGTYTATWKAAALRGLHHFGVNALSRGTLYDDEARYDSQAWILPYRTVPEDSGELAATD